MNTESVKTQRLGSQYSKVRIKSKQNIKVSKLEGNINHVLCFVLCVRGSRDHNKSPILDARRRKVRRGESRGLRILPNSCAIKGKENHANAKQI